MLDLLDASLGGGPAGRRPPEFFTWKHLDNPFGRSLPAWWPRHDDRLIGLRAFMRWRLAAGDRDLTAVRAVDAATHPDFQGMGVFSRLTGRLSTPWRARSTWCSTPPTARAAPAT